MPPIPQARLFGLIPFSDQLAETPRELNYQITMLLFSYLDERGPSYAVFNDIFGALEGARLEFYRRVVAPYEDRKASQNGDVFA